MAFKAFTCFLFLALTSTSAASARILDKELPPIHTVAPETSDSVNSKIPPVAATPVGTPLTVAPVGIRVPGVTWPNIKPAAAISETVPNTNPHHLSFYMHANLGRSIPSAKAVTGIVTNPAANGQLPFSKPNGPVLPVNNDIPLNNNNHNLPFLTGLSSSTKTLVQNNGNNLINSFGLPGGNLVEKLMFGTMSVINNELTEGHELGSGLVGKAQGFYVVTSKYGSSHTMAFTVMFESGNYVDSISLFGVHRSAVSESQIGITGGTGKYVNAKGYATVKTIHSDQQHTDGLETLEFAVYLS